MSTPNELVSEAFAQARTYANDAQSKLTDFTNALNAALQLAPTVDVSFTPIPSPGAETPPSNMPTYTPPAAYTSSLLDTLLTTLNTRLAGGTGLAPSVEAAIWDRARDRELATAQAAIDEVTAQAESLAFELPPGVLNDGIRRETRAYYDKSSTFSRDVAVKQAELEQTNMQQTIEKAISYENTLSEILQRRTQVAVDVFRTQILGFQAEIESFRAQVDQDVKFWEVTIKQLEAQRDYVLQGQKINADIIHANLATVLDAAKAGAQVYAQLASSAYSLIHASASVGATANEQVSYSYSNDTTDAVPPVTSI